MVKPDIDYSLYLVTGRELLPEGKDYLESLQESIVGGVTVVQCREKDADTGEFLRIAQQTQALCKRYSIPLIINDRIDIALAVGAAGVHLGQTDMPLSVARALLPSDTILGVSCNTKEHAKKAIEDGADYIGIGSVWGTATKDVTGKVIGVRGVGEVLDQLEGTNVKAVAIGGVKSVNVLRTLHGSVSLRSARSLDGIAVVSDIVAAKNPALSAATLSSVIRAFKSAMARPNSILAHHLFSASSLEKGYSIDYIQMKAAGLIETVRKFNPLVHQITNTVVTNQSANATLALGASPIMATAPHEMEDLQKVTGALLVNFGTISDKEGMLLAGHHANLNRKPVVFDPVGVGATAYRRTTANELLNRWQATVIKGNAAEIGAIANSVEVQAKGVDSNGRFADPARVIRDLARKERCIVVLSGATDYISNGSVVLALKNGHSLLGKITGSGCMLGTSVATFCGAARLDALENEKGNDTEEDGKLVKGDMLIGAVGGVLALTIASEIAAEREDVRGSGTFLPALIDELGNLTPEVIYSRAKIEVL